ncbi:MAG: glycyl-radical enzyme activating protein [Peptococcales bacterium]
MLEKITTKGMVFNIQRFSLHDGPGIRTNVFLKGCPLHCVWCHNPEGLSKKKQLAYWEDRCVSCRMCEKVCPGKVHSFSAEGRHDVERHRCISCKECKISCPYNALEWIGQELTASEVIETVLRDKPFYGDQGGLTLTGGEPMAQPDFTLALAMLAKKEGLNVCMETSGFCDWKELARVAPHIDLFLFDCKESRPQQHEMFTGVKPDIIWSNLKKLDKTGKRIILRCPLIPGLNTCLEHYEGIGKLAGNLKNLLQIDLEPYHALGIEKRVRLGMTESFSSKEKILPEQLQQAVSILKTMVSVSVTIN